jgi:hypothetical protein
MGKPKQAAVDIAKVSAKLAAATNPRVAIVDELRKLTNELAPIAKKLKKVEALRKKVREWPNEDKVAASATVAYKGTKGTVLTLGACENKRTVTSIQKVQETLGLEWLIAHCKVTLEDLESALPAGIDELVSEALTGSRAITIAKVA